MNAFPWFVRFTIALLLGFAALLLLRQAIQLYRQAMQKWHSTRGQVLRAEVQEKLVSVRIFTSAARRRLAKRYQPVLAYEYWVAGHRFESERIFIGQAVLYSSAKDAQKALQRYPKPGEPITIWYTPQNPAEAVLQKSLHWQFWVFLLIGMSLLAFTAILLLQLETDKIMDDNNSPSSGQEYAHAFYTVSRSDRNPADSL